mmetsp:Transcript_2515/g.7585  ORF Transcript_2515/g.7585 Transcript_2515/m.7585 type:complete len:214 (+) Transcript_2515:1813-2454(+)
MPHKLLRLLVQSKSFVQLRHRDLLEVAPLVCRRVLWVVILAIAEELGCSSLLEEAHEGRLESFHGSGWHLLYLAGVDDKAAIYCFELQILCDVCFDQYLDEIAICHDEFGHHINVEVAAGTQLFGRGLSRPESLPQLVKIQRRRLASVVIVAVHVQYLQAVHGQQTTNDALREASAQYDGIVLLVHFGFHTVPRDSQPTASPSIAALSRTKSL